MTLPSVILDAVVTEKAERLKALQRTHVLTVSPGATKVDVQHALERFFGVIVSSIRVLHVRPKRRTLGAGTMEKRHRAKRVLVTLDPKSKALDLTAFQTI